MPLPSNQDDGEMSPPDLTEHQKATWGLVVQGHDHKVSDGHVTFDEMHAIDKNDIAGDGKEAVPAISIEEATRSAPAGGPPPTIFGNAQTDPEVIQKRFNLVDENHDGLVTKQELNEVFGPDGIDKKDDMFPAFADPPPDKGFDFWQDTVRSGYEQETGGDVDENVLPENAPGIAAGQGVFALGKDPQGVGSVPFDKLDDNHDGKLQPDEVFTPNSFSWGEHIESGIFGHSGDGPGEAGDERFDLVDRNDDGEVSEAEYKHYFGENGMDRNDDHYDDIVNAENDPDHDPDEPATEAPDT
ncbi:unnamed protein product, partial [Amoebophrya sp. A120]|eukprot:GSA120T00026253001.1